MNIPCLHFGEGGLPLHFAHANGYPPAAYTHLLEALGERYRVCAMEARPLWPNASHAVLTDWRPLSGDLITFLEEHCPGEAVVGMGHSVGGNATLRAALYRPDLFRSLVLVDPVLFPPLMGAWWNLTYLLGLGYRLHPLARGALRRRRKFESKQAMFENYRRKRVFSRLDDAAMWAYVNALAEPDPSGDGFRLRYSPEWEARIYVTGLRADGEIWRKLSRLRLPVLVIRGAQTDTFWEKTAARFQRKVPHAEIVTLPDSTHLLPLERPAEVARLVREFVGRMGDGGR